MESVGDWVPTIAGESLNFEAGENMNKLTESMQHIIRNFSVGAVATVNDDGSPAVSPKATFVVVNDRCIVFGNVRSPATCANLRKRPGLEVNFTDVLARVALRVRGTARLVAKDSEQGQKLILAFEPDWGDYLFLVQEFVCIEIDRVELIMSPAYDVGLTRDELVLANLEKLQKIANQ